MGNCMGSSRILAQDRKQEPPREAGASKEMRSIADGKLESVRPVDEGKETTRFKECRENDVGRGRHGDFKGGVVRIRVVMTQGELNQILKYKKDWKFSSVEQFFSAVKLRSGRVLSEGRRREGGMKDSWRPSLDSIPEDH